MRSAARQAPVARRSGNLKTMQIVQSWMLDVRSHRIGELVAAAMPKYELLVNALVTHRTRQSAH